MRALLRRACLTVLWVAIAALATFVVALRADLGHARKEIETLRRELRELHGLRPPRVMQETDDGQPS